MKKILISLIAIYVSIHCFSQNEKDKKEALIYSQKIAFITEKLQISPEEAQKFWPLYNEYWKSKNELIEKRNAITKIGNEELNKLSENQLIELANNYAEIRLKEAELFHKYNAKFQEVISAKKVLLLYVSDSEFKNYLLKQLQSQNK